jgi:hypothetical protein
LNFVDLILSDNTAGKFFSFRTQDGGNNAEMSINSAATKSLFYQLDATSGYESSIELLGAELRVKTPKYTSASNGDVLTLLDNTTGEAEWQTPGSGPTGDTLSPLLLMGG